MKTFLASLLLLAVIAVICSPIYLIWIGLSADYPMWRKTLLFVAGLIMCRLVKPVSVLSGKDFKVI